MSGHITDADEGWLHRSSYEPVKSTSVGIMELTWSNAYGPVSTKAKCIRCSKPFRRAPNEADKDYLLPGSGNSDERYVCGDCLTPEERAIVELQNLGQQIE